MKNSAVSIVVFGALVASACGPSGSPPQVQPLEDRVVAVSEELVIQIDASDTDGDSLSYSYSTDVPEIRSRATMSQLPIGAGEFRWTPMASDVGIWYFDFKVSDGDYTETVTVQIDVRSAVGANSAPKFLSPVSNGTTLNLGEVRCLSLDVEVDDSDSVEVELAQAEPVIEGAELEQTSGLGGRWNWCPTPDQINASNRYTLSLSADDGDNPPTVLRYLVVLRRAVKDNCPGAEPIIAHTPSDRETLGNIVVSAEITDDQGLKEAPIVFYSTTEPSSPPNLAAMSLAPMTRVQGDNWEASLPNPVAAASAGTSAELYYVILASDDDDPAGACDHEALAPSSGSFSMTVTNPGGFGGVGVCESCSADAQCGDAADDLCVRVGGGGASYCLSSCSGEGDCPSGYSCSAQPVESVEGASARQCIPDNQSCEIECIDDAYEDNDTRLQADQKPALQDGDLVDAMSCPLGPSTGDNDIYRIDLEGDADIDLQLVGGDASDLDLYLFDEGGVVVLSSAGMSSDESIDLCLSAGAYYAVVVPYGDIGPNPYLLEYTASSTTCSTPICTDDENGEDDGPAGATQVILDGQGRYSSGSEKICSGDEDWYVINLYDGETLSALLEFVHADGDLDLGIFDVDGSTVLEAGVSTTDDELVFFTLDDPTCTVGEPACPFYVAVLGYDSSQNDYVLTLEVSE